MSFSRYFRPLLMLFYIGCRDSATCASNISMIKLKNVYDEDEICLLFPGNTKCLYPTYNSCKMGFIHKNMSFSTTRTQIPQCIIRGPRDRQSLYNVYGTQHEAIKSLINSLLIEDSNQISNLIFIGDSVTVQFANFFVCDAMRAGISYTSQSRHIDESMSKFPHHITEYMIVKNRSENRILRVHYQQLNPPCLRRPQDSACANSSFASDSTTRYVYAILDHFRHSNNLSSCFGQRNYLLFNYGLHLHQKHRPHILPAIVRAVYTFAHQQMHRQEGGGTGAAAAFTAVLYVETVAQVFSGSSDGVFRWDLANTSSDPHDFCCSPPKSDPRATEWRNADVLQQLSLLAPGWRNELGWVEWYEHSLALFDLRTEFHSLTSHIDCTHFVYSPVAYGSLWQAIRSGIEYMNSLLLA